MRFRGVYVATMCGRDKDRATGVSSLANEEPLVVVKVGIDTVGEVVGEDGGDGHSGVVREGEASLCRGGRGSVRQRTFGAEDGYIGRSPGACSHRGSEVFASGGGDEDIVRVDGDILVERGEKESVEDFLGNLGRSGRHGRWGETIEPVSFYNVRRPGFLRGMFGWLL
jgi:hypothetical protein